MSAKTNYTIKAGIALAALYVALFYLSVGYLSETHWVGGVASLLFLPAFIRLLGYLIIGPWVIPALLVAALFCVDLGLDLNSRILVSAFLAVGGPLGVAVTSWICKLKPNLDNLTGPRLLILSAGCAAGNSIFYSTALALVGHKVSDLTASISIFVGDFAGTWLIIYCIKMALTLWGKSLAK